MGAAVTIMLIKERQIAEAFMRAGATSVSSAVAPADIAVDLASIGGRRLTRGAIIREAEEGRYYLDLAGWEALRRTAVRRTDSTTWRDVNLGATAGTGYRCEGAGPLRADAKVLVICFPRRMR